MSDLKGAAVLITGASSGIGAATAVAFARRRSRLALCARRLDRLQQVAERCRAAGAAEVVVRRADLSRSQEARAFVNVALQQFERVDVLVNNAGVRWGGRLEDMPEADVHNQIATNLEGCVWTIQAALPSMLAAGSGVIINVSSTVGFRATPYAAVYSATKYAVTGLSHALRGELSGTGVKVCAVYPGTTATELFQGREPINFMTRSPEWVARAIVRTAARPRRDVIIAPYRLAYLAEPIFGGLADHVIGEAARRHEPDLR